MSAGSKRDKKGKQPVVQSAEREEWLLVHKKNKEQDLKKNTHTHLETALNRFDVTFWDHKRMDDQ